MSEADARGRREYTVCPYRQSDVAKCCQVIDEAGGYIQSVAIYRLPSGINGGWQITYRHTEELTFELLC